MADVIQTTEHPGASGGVGGPTEEALRAEVGRPEVNQQTIDPGLLAVQVRGELDLATVGHLEASLDRGLRRESSALLIDLTGCGFIDSSVVWLLFDLRGRMGDSGRPRFAVVAQGQPHRLLHLTGLDHKIPVCASLPEALRALEGAEASES
jgi:anti-sigma B factor antagonist